MKNKKRTRFFLNELKHFANIRANRYFFVVLVLVIVFLAFFAKLDDHPENYTWIYSTSMQVLGALIALLPISYSFYLSNIDTKKENAYDTYVLEKLKKDGYYELMFVITISVFTIVINLVFFFLENTLVNAIIAAFFSLLSIQLVTIFIYQLFDPERVNYVLREFDVPTAFDSTHKRITLDEFADEFMKLEIVVKDFVTKDNAKLKIDKMPLYDIIDKFKNDYKKLEIFYEDFKEIIFHRNNVIHNYADVIIDSNKYAKVVSLIKEFTKANDEFVSLKLVGNVSTIRNKIDISINEYLNIIKNNFGFDINQNNYERKLGEVISSHFESPHYTTKLFEKGSSTDFEIVQNNYTNRKLVGIDFKRLDSNRFNETSKDLFRKLQGEFMYIFTINYNAKNNLFEVSYLTKENKMRYYIK